MQTFLDLKSDKSRNFSHRDELDSAVQLLKSGRGRYAIIYRAQAIASYIFLYTVFARLDAVATIHHLSLCGIYSRAATIQEQRLLVQVAAREAIRRETVD